MTDTDIQQTLNGPPESDSPAGATPGRGRGRPMPRRPFTLAKTTGKFASLDRNLRRLGRLVEQELGVDSATASLGQSAAIQSIVRHEMIARCAMVLLGEPEATLSERLSLLSAIRDSTKQRDAQMVRLGLAPKVADASDPWSSLASPDAPGDALTGGMTRHTTITERGLGEAVGDGGQADGS